MVFYRRTQDGDARWLQVRMVLLALGGVLGLIGMATEITWLVLSALAVLFAGMLLGLIGRRRHPADIGTDTPAEEE